VDEHGAAGSVRADVGRTLAFAYRRPVAADDAHCRTTAGEAAQAAAAVRNGTIPRAAAATRMPDGIERSLVDIVATMALTTALEVVT